MDRAFVNGERSQTCQIRRRTRRGTPAVYQIRTGCRRKWSILLKSGICERHVVMDVRVHTVVWDHIHHGDHGAVRK